MLQAPARQQRLAAGLPAAQQLGVALRDRCAAEHSLSLSGSGDVSLGAVVDQQTGVSMRDSLVVGPGLQAGCDQLRDQRYWKRQG